MTFGELFRDCFQQARRAGRAILPKITGGMVGDAGLKLETSNIPMPECLGDMIKLFGLATDNAPRHDGDFALGYDLGQIIINRANPPDIAAAIGIIEGSLAFSPVAWRLAMMGEFRAFGGWPNDELFSEKATEGECLEQATTFLNLFVIGHFTGIDARADAASFKRDLIRANPRNYIDVLIRFAALVSCGIGVSAFEWSKKVWTPVLVALGKHQILGLISSADLGLKAASPGATGNEYHLATPVGSGFTITYGNMVISTCLESESPRPRHRCVGLLPDFQAQEKAEEVFLKRRKELEIDKRSFIAVTVNNAKPAFKGVALR